MIYDYSNLDILIKKRDCKQTLYITDNISQNNYLNSIRKHELYNNCVINNT